MGNGLVTPVGPPFLGEALRPGVLFMGVWGRVGRGLRGQLRLFLGPLRRAEGGGGGVLDPGGGGLSWWVLLHVHGGWLGEEGTEAVLGCLGLSVDVHHRGPLDELPL